MARCIKCGAKTGLSKEVCSDCSDTASEDNDPAPIDTQQDDDGQHRVDLVSGKKVITAFWLVLSQIGAIVGAFVVGFTAIFDSRNSTETVESFVVLTLIFSFVSWIQFSRRYYKSAGLLSSMPLLFEFLSLLETFFSRM